MAQKVNDPASGRAIGTAVALKGIAEGFAATLPPDQAQAFADRAQLTAQRMLNSIADQLGPDAQFGAQEALKVIFTNLDLPRV